VISDISWILRTEKSECLPSRYWVPDLPDSYLRAWKSVNPKGRRYYETVTLPYYKSCV
jgi:hypothetical protein